MEGVIRQNSMCLDDILIYKHYMLMCPSYECMVYDAYCIFIYYTCMRLTVLVYT